MTITIKIIADSVSDAGHRITTFQLRYPRFIHSEVMTHRVFSRSASSSRAIPISRLIEDVEQDIAMPVAWGRNQPGMQAGEEMTPQEQQNAQALWRESAYQAIGTAYRLQRTGAHKQIVNRVLEPYAHISVVLTATNFDNFFALRVHKDADPTIHELALFMWYDMQNSTPKRLGNNQWHLPYITQEDTAHLPTGPTIEDLKRMSAARCARVSYNNHDGTRPSVEDDMRLWDQLTGSPMHASPMEHQATPSDDKALWGNLTGWAQHRKMIAGESV